MLAYSTQSTSAQSGGSARFGSRVVDRLGDCEADREGTAPARSQHDRPAEEERAALVDALKAGLGVGDGLDRVPRQAGGWLRRRLHADAFVVVAKGQLRCGGDLARDIVRGPLASLGLVISRRVVAAAEQVDVPFDRQLERERQFARVLDRNLELQPRVQSAAAERKRLGHDQRTVGAIEIAVAEPAQWRRSCRL